mmetsp:Transcript_65210/g.121560  ORF Transcript_65210/g.121560 Transcript_65210/m.121560 type:complete len:224 (+) Transcript_65210:627-1298(+)
MNSSYSMTPLLSESMSWKRLYTFLIWFGLIFSMPFVSFFTNASTLTNRICLAADSDCAETGPNNPCAVKVDFLADSVASNCLYCSASRTTFRSGLAAGGGKGGGGCVMSLKNSSNVTWPSPSLSHIRIISSTSSSEASSPISSRICRISIAPTNLFLSRSKVSKASFISSSENCLCSRPGTKAFPGGASLRGSPDMCAGPGIELPHLACCDPRICTTEPWQRF